VTIDFFWPGKPTDKVITESFNGRFRDEGMNIKRLVSLEDAREKIEGWRQDYDWHRPLSSQVI
jgi:putative transposase